MEAIEGYAIQNSANKMVQNQLLYVSQRSICRVQKQDQLPQYKLQSDAAINQHLSLILSHLFKIVLIIYVYMYQDSNNPFYYIVVIVISCLFLFYLNVQIYFSPTIKETCFAQRMSIYLPNVYRKFSASSSELLIFFINRYLFFCISECVCSAVID